MVKRFLDFNYINVHSGKVQKNSGYLESEIVAFEHFEELEIIGLPRRTDCIILGLCHSGTACFTVDTERRCLTRNSVIIVSDHQVVDRFERSEDFSGKALIISRNFFDECVSGLSDLSSLLLFVRSHPVFDVDDDTANLINNYFRALVIKINEESNHYRKEVVRSIFSTLIYDICNVMHNFIAEFEEDSIVPRGNVIFVQFLRLVEKNFRQERRVSWYAEQLCISAKYLSEVIRQVSHRTPTDWIDNYVVLEIRVLLKNTNKSIKEIAQDLNFPTQSFLGKFFKERTGLGPSAYRKTMK